MDNLFLTVIIPIYNAAGYLARTLDSLLEQDISDYEILCINDGSQDTSPVILEEYSRLHSRIRVIHQDNAGVAAARNRGLENARGRYIWFVDADDLVAPNCLGKLKALAEEHLCQRLSFGGYTFAGELSDRERETWRKGKLPCNVPYQDSVVWRNWLRRDFLEEKGLFFRYPEITHGEDGLFMFEVSRQKPWTVDISDILYFYRVHPGSAESSLGIASQRKRLRSHLRVVEVLSGYYRTDRSETAANKLVSYLWYSLYEITNLPKKDAVPALGRLKALGLFPGQIPAECTLKKSYLVDDSGLMGKLVEALCIRLHRPWAYRLLRLLRQGKKLLKE